MRKRNKEEEKGQLTVPRVGALTLRFESLASNLMLKFGRSPTSEYCMVAWEGACHTPPAHLGGAGEGGEAAHGGLVDVQVEHGPGEAEVQPPVDAAAGEAQLLQAGGGHQLPDHLGGSGRRGRPWRKEHNIPKMLLCAAIQRKCNYCFQTKICIKVQIFLV